MKNELQLNYENRLKTVLTMDKNENPLKLKTLLKSEILNILNNYMEVSDDAFNIDITVDNDGYYKLKIICLAKHLKSITYFI